MIAEQILTDTFLLEEGIDENIIATDMDIIQSKAIECIENGSEEAAFNHKGLTIYVIKTSAINDLDTEDEYCLMVRKYEDEEE